MKVTCTGFYVYIEIINIDSSPDPDIFAPYVYSDPSDETIRRLYGIPSEENYIVIIEVENNKRLQFQINWLNIERDTSVKARHKIHLKILNFHIPFVTLTLT